MKKQLITLLMAGLLVVGFGGSALAASGTITGTGDAGDPITPSAGVSVDITKNIPVDFIINIPTAIEPNSAATITADKVNIADDHVVKVKVGGTSLDATGKLSLTGTLGTKATKLEATLKKGDASGTAIPVDSEVAVFSTVSDSAIDADSGTGVIFTDLPAVSNKFSDKYKGTLTFLVEYEAGTSKLPTI